MIEHDKALIKGVDIHYPEEIEFLNTLSTEFGGGYHIDYADVDEDDEWAELVGRFGDGYDKFVGVLYAFSRNSLNPNPKTQMIDLPTFSASAHLPATSVVQKRLLHSLNH